MLYRLILALSCLFAVTACQPDMQPVEPEPAEAVEHLNAECNAPIDLTTHQQLLEWARAHLDQPMQIEPGVVYIPDGFGVTESADARQMTTYALVQPGRLDVALPGPGPRPGTYWDCQCTSENDDGCYWRHLGGLSYCKGSCGNTSCRSVALEYDKPGVIDGIFP